MFKSKKYHSTKFGIAHNEIVFSLVTIFASMQSELNFVCKLERLRLKLKQPRTHK